jgi:hypothetical protein
MLLSSVFLKKKEEKKKREKWPGGFFPGQTHLIGCATPGFSWLLGAIRAVLRVSP